LARTDKLFRRYGASQNAEALPGLKTLSPPADVVGVPTAPAHASETSQVRGDGPPGSPLMSSDASLGFCDLSLQIGYVFSGLSDAKRCCYCCQQSCVRRPWWSPRRSLRMINYRRILVNDRLMPPVSAKNQAAFNGGRRLHSRNVFCSSSAVISGALPANSRSARW